MWPAKHTYWSVCLEEQENETEQLDVRILLVEGKSPEGANLQSEELMKSTNEENTLISQERLAELRYDIWIASRDGASLRRLTTHIGAEVLPRFSPDGNWVASRRQASIIRLSFAMTLGAGIPALDAASQGEHHCFGPL